MNSWGNSLKSSCFVVAQMTALGFGLSKNTFTDKLSQGDYYLSPTGVDLRKTNPG
jgi:hypothetical protein